MVEYLLVTAFVAVIMLGVFRVFSGALERNLDGFLKQMRWPCP